MKNHSIKITVIVALVALIGAQCVGAAVKHHATNADLSAPSAAALPAAELDPVFQQKLVQRARGPFERAHPSNPPM